MRTVSEIEKANKKVQERPSDVNGLMCSKNSTLVIFKE